MRTFLTLLVVGILLSIVGASVEGLLWLTVPGMLTFLGAVAYAVLSPRRSDRNVDASSSNGDAHLRDAAAASHGSLRVRG
jgi:hypothetical protein